jgi:H+/Cl- antiporter ClcA
MSSLHAACAGWPDQDWPSTAAMACDQVSGHDPTPLMLGVGFVCGSIATYMAAALIRYAVRPAYFTFDDRLAYLMCVLLGGLFTTIVSWLAAWVVDVNVGWAFPFLAGALFFSSLRGLSHWRCMRNQSQESGMVG